MKSQSTTTRISQPRLTIAPGGSKRASRTDNPKNRPQAIEFEERRLLSWSWQVPMIAVFLLVLSQAWAEGGQAESALGAPPAETPAKAGNGPVGANNSSPTAIEQVRISRNEQQTEVHVDGSGPLSYVTFRLSDPDRLVLDFSDALVHMARKLIPSDVEPVRAVRVGQFKPDVTRVVIDLASEVPYTIREDGNVVTVAFSSAAETDPGVESKKQPPVVGNAIPSSFTPQSVPDVPPPVVAQESPATHAAPSGTVSAELRRRPAQTTQQAPSAPVAKQASAVDKAEPVGPAASPLPDRTRRADLPGSTTKPPARAEPSATGPAELYPGGNDASQAAPPDPVAKEESKETSESIQTPSDEDYVIGIDDVLAINVWKEPEISRAVAVRPDGKISLPLIGELKASGLTPQGLQATISTKLRSYLYEPEVTVIVHEIRSQRFNIVGEVNRPGTYPLIKPMTVLDAIALAGGFRDFARITKIYVLRLRPDGSRMLSPFNYKHVIKGHKFDQNMELEPHDTIVVP